jgi:GT2 family glycosyltransferase/SAM-dependent methyltransferase/glycosyltransferase involved in cell wall biosynthesis
MEFTGERYVPTLDAPEISYEHWHRYLYALTLVEGKTVLDIACGEGYGTALLAQKATRVVGIDVNVEAVAHAARTYLQPNLEFRTGCAEALPIAESQVFEVIVSFETIEHLDEHKQIQFLNEVKRLLKPEGVFLISTPNKRTYSDQANYRNKFHLKEFYESEFCALLGRFFRTVHLNGQRVYPVSCIWPWSHASFQEVCQLAFNRGHFAPTDGNRMDPLYMLAVCSEQSNHALPGSVLLDVSERATRGRLEQLDHQAQIIEHQRKCLQDRGMAPGELAQLRQTVRNQQECLQSLRQFVEQSLAVMQTALRHASPAASQAIAYQQLIWRIRKCTKSTLPSGARVLVVSKGDARLLQLEGPSGQHFPQRLDGAYSGFHPADSWAAIAHLEALRAQGAEYLLIPGCAFWWLDHYAEFGRHLLDRYATVVHKEDTCVILDLKKAGARSSPAGSCELEQVLAAIEDSSAALPSILDWGTGLELAAKFPMHRVFSPPSLASTLPYADRSVDVVALTNPDPGCAAEARRVATSVVATFRTAAAGSDDANQVEVEWISDPRMSETPTVSVVIPCHNQAAITEGCLRALLDTLPAAFRGEILAVDDGSTDGTRALLQRWAEPEKRLLKIVSNQENIGFVRSCNKAAQQATGEYLVFLNNDTVPLPGWLPPLVQTLRDYPDAGAVGGKLIYSDGTLQEAGGIIFSDGTGANFGKGDSESSHPLYEYVRAVDYCSGALLATPRSLFLQLGGFDEAYCPAYYEDTDYCFRLGEAGYRVYYQPETRIVHYEGATSGTDPRRGVKQHQANNRQTFVRRWASALQQRPSPPAHYDRKTWRALAGQEAPRSHGCKPPLRALVCAPTMPEYDRESGSQRMLDLIDFLQGAGWSVTFICKCAGPQRYARLLQQRGMATYAGPKMPWADIIAAGQFDLAVLAFWHVAEEFLPLIRTLSPQTRVLVDSVDLHFVRNARRLFRATQGPGCGSLDRNYGSEMLRELNAYAAADGVLTVSQKERDLVNDLTGDCGLAHAVPDGEGLDVSTVPFVQRKGILFIGNFQHPPNVVAAEKLCNAIVPLLNPELLHRHPLSIVGNGLNEKVQSYGVGVPNVHMVGWVPSLLPYLHSARITVVPLSYGAGTKRKLIQALMAGTPTVSTSTGVEGLNLVDGEHVLVADDPATFARAVSRLIDDSSLWHRLSSKGREWINQSHGRETARAKLVESVAATLARDPKKAPAANAGTQIRLEPDNYARLPERIRGVARDLLPCDATVLVVSKGDERLLDLGQRCAWHFPRTVSGSYAGHHPSDSAAAINHLESLREQGAAYLLFPATSLWWLDHYREFRHHLDSHHCLLIRQDDVCAIYELLDSPLPMGRLSEGDS